MSITTFERQDGTTYQIVSIGFEPCNRTCSVERSLAATAMYVAAEDAGDHDTLGRVSTWLFDHDLEHPIMLGFERIRTNEKTKSVYERAYAKFKQK